MNSSIKKPLRESTIFDFTQDQQLLETVIGITGITFERYKDLVGQRAIILDMIGFAEETGDIELLTLLEAEFSEELARFFNE